MRVESRPTQNYKAALKNEALHAAQLVALHPWGVSPVQFLRSSCKYWPMQESLAYKGFHSCDAL